jgi:hypothetical protein
MPPPGAAPPVPQGPQHGEVITVRDHRGVEMDVTFDATVGQWVTPDNTWFDPSRAEEARRQYAADRAWSAAEHERMAEGDTAQDRALRELSEYQRLITEDYQNRINNRRKRAILEKMQKVWEGESESWRHQARREDWGLWVAEWTQVLADVGIDLLAGVTGKTGQSIKKAYVATKNIAGGMSEAYSDGTSLTKGAAKGLGNAAIELGFDEAKSCLGKATKGKYPGLPDGPNPSLQKIGEFVPETNADTIFKERMIQSTINHASLGAAQGRAEEKVLTKLEKKLGLKQ